MSLVQIDDTDSRFDYKDNAWKAGGQTGEFGSTSHSASTAGAMVKFGPFTGTSIAVFSTVGTSQTKLHFAVDGDVQNTDLPAQSSSSVRFQQQLYSAGNLDPTAQHTLAINLLDAGPFTLDYVVIGGQVNTALQKTTTSPSSTASSEPTTSSNAGTLSGTTPTADPSIFTTATQSVGGTSTSSSTLSTSDIFTSFIPDSVSTPSPFTITPSSSLFPPATASGHSAAPASAGGASMSAASSDGPDAVVIGSVAGSITLFAIVVVSVVLFLRRRRRRSAHPLQPDVGKKSSDPKPKHRPALHLSIPSSLSLTRSLQRPPILPMHSKSSSTPDKQTDPFGISHTAPSFLAEDPNDSPVLDIKQRPVSGATMTTRVTVGTTIDQRVSVPDSVYRYPNPGTPKPIPVPVPPLPQLPSKSLNPSPTETGASSAPSHYDFGLLGMNPAETFDTTVFSGYAENGTAGTGSVPSASRPLPLIPTDAKRAHPDRGPDDYASQIQHYPDTHRYPVAPSDAEAVIHQDGGVRLESNIQIRPRRELPPPYHSFGD